MSTGTVATKLGTVVRLKGTNLFKTNLKDTDDVMIVRSRDFG